MSSSCVRCCTRGASRGAKHGCIVGAADDATSARCPRWPTRDAGANLRRYVREGARGFAVAENPARTTPDLRGRSGAHELRDARDVRRRVRRHLTASNGSWSHCSRSRSAGFLCPRLLRHRRPVGGNAGSTAETRSGRTALVMPVYNENPARTFSAPLAMAEALLELDAAAFELFYSPIRRTPRSTLNRRPPIAAARGARDRIRGGTGAARKTRPQGR